MCAVQAGSTTIVLMLSMSMAGPAGGRGGRTSMDRRWQWEAMSGAGLENSPTELSGLQQVVGKR